MNATKLTTRNPSLNRPSPHPQLQELAASDNTVLTLGELPHPVV